jgi:hypothetical protein
VFMTTACLHTHEHTLNVFSSFSVLQIGLLKSIGSVKFFLVCLLVCFFKGPISEVFFFSVRRPSYGDYRRCVHPKGCRGMSSSLRTTLQCFTASPSQPCTQPSLAEVDGVLVAPMLAVWPAVWEGLAASAAFTALGRHRRSAQHPGRVVALEAGRAVGRPVVKEPYRTDQPGMTAGETVPQ